MLKQARGVKLTFSAAIPLNIREIVCDLEDLSP